MKQTTVIVALLAVAAPGSRAGRRLRSGPGPGGARRGGLRVSLCHLPRREWRRQGADRDHPPRPAERPGDPIYPRDFTAGVYKFRSTPSGSLPTDEDLMRTITEGISRSGMPSHSDRLAGGPASRDRVHQDVLAQVAGAEGLGADRHRCRPQLRATPDSDRPRSRGYALMQCAKCHGDTGRGDGPSSACCRTAGATRSSPSTSPPVR